MKKPKGKVYIKQTKRDKEKAELMEKVMDSQITKEEWELMQKSRMIEYIDYLKNPLGLVEVKWEEKI